MRGVNCILGFVVAVAFAAALAVVRPADADAARFAPCARSGAVECTTVRVPLDRAGVTPGTVRLHVERVRARGFPSAPPLLVLAGGPGQSASLFTSYIAHELAPALRGRDLVVFDQRGTGRSGALRCWPFSSFDIRGNREWQEAVAACGSSLGPRAGHYATADSVEDVEAVREAIGAETIALLGVSYGTKVALVYAARYPARVERLVLDSVVPPDGPDVFWRSSFRAVPRVLRAVCGSRCPFTPDAAADVTTLVRSLAAGPARGYVVGRDGRRYPRRLGRVDLFELLLSGDFDADVRAALPGVLRSAAAGDLAPLLRMREDAKAAESHFPGNRIFSPALFVATMCADAVVPWGADVGRTERIRLARALAYSTPPGDFEPFDAATGLAAGTLPLCASWPVAPAAPPPATVLPDVQALLLAGTHDLRTPLEDALAVGAHLARARVLPVRGVGHSVLSTGPSCVRNAIADFLRGRARTRCGASRTLVPDGPAPSSLADVGTPASGRPQRLLVAARLTLEDVLGRLPAAAVATWPRRSSVVHGGGLRGGRFTASTRRLVLERVEYVSGVTVDGTIAGDVSPWFGRLGRARGTLRVRHGGLTATLTLRDGVLYGTVAGVRVALPLRSVA